MLTTVLPSAKIFFESIKEIITRLIPGGVDMVRDRFLHTLEGDSFVQEVCLAHAVCLLCYGLCAIPFRIGRYHIG
jgi:hypothetical protein